MEKDKHYNLEMILAYANKLKSIDYEQWLYNMEIAYKDRFWDKTEYAIVVKKLVLNLMQYLDKDKDKKQ